VFLCGNGDGWVIRTLKLGGCGYVKFLEVYLPFGVVVRAACGDQVICGLMPPYK